MVQQRPERFDADVGTGQVTAWAGVMQFQFDQSEVIAAFRQTTH